MDLRGTDGQKCANCGIRIRWDAVIVGDQSFCCGGCAQGGPCYCSYDPPLSGTGRVPVHRRSATAPTDDPLIRVVSESGPP